MNQELFDFHQTCKLGKLAPKHSDKIVEFKDYVDDSILPPPPTKYAWEPPLDGNHWGMMENDEIGDCTCAEQGHAVMLVTAANGSLVIPTDEEVVALYSLASGYNPATGENDNGAAITDVLNLMRTTGLAGQKILGSASINPLNTPHVKVGVFLFGGLDIGIQLPLAFQGESEWVMPPEGLVGNGAPGSWGGHSVLVIGFDEDVVIFISWGQIYTMQWAVFNSYVDESYAEVFPGFFTNGKDPIGIKMAQLQTDLNAIQ